MKVKAMIFDMDGVVMDSMHKWRNLASDYLRSEGKVPDPDINRRIQAMSIGEAARIIRRDYGIEKTPEKIVDDIIGRIGEFYHKESTLKKRAEEGLKQLRVSGIKMCVATSTNKDLAEVALKRCGVLGLFEFVLSSADVGGGKDRPDLFLECARRLGEDPENVMVIEDSPVAIETAKGAGFRTCGVRDENQDVDFAELEELADRCITHITELYPAE